MSFGLKEFITEDSESHWYNRSAAVNLHRKGGTLEVAERRMFTKKVTDDDNFASLSSSAQALYLHLSMSADDDGFCNQVSIAMFKAHASVQDLEALLSKRYVYQFENGVIVIKHWRMANALRKDRYTPTNFQEEFKQLRLKENGAYTLSTNTVDDWLPCGCQVEDTGKDRIDKDRLGKDSIGYINSSNTNVLDCPTESDKSEGKFVYEKETTLWNELKTLGIAPIRGIVAQSKRASLLKARLKQYGSDSFAEIIEAIKESDFLQGKHQGKPWQVTFDWVILPSNYPKVLEGNYKNKKTTTRSQFDDFDIEG